MNGGDPSGYETVGDADYNEETDIAAILVPHNTTIEDFEDWLGIPPKAAHTFEGYFLDAAFTKEIPEEGKFDTWLSIYLKYEPDGE